jgi:uncharacterized membrane protein (Fun14 family)
MMDSTLTTFTASGVAGFCMGIFLRRVLKYLVIIIGSFIGAVFLVIQWMQARQYIGINSNWRYHLWLTSWKFNNLIIHLMA